MYQEGRNPFSARVGDPNRRDQPTRHLGTQNLGDADFYQGLNAIRHNTEYAQIQQAMISKVLDPNDSLSMLQWLNRCNHYFSSIMQQLHDLLTGLGIPFSRARGVRGREPRTGPQGGFGRTTGGSSYRY